ncbi:hypothetical protein ES332_D11G105800v1, partial [Gossypium tomentosum]
HSCINDPSSDPFSNASPISPPSSNSQRSISVFSRTGIIVLLSLMVILGVFAPWSGMSQSMFSISRKVSSLSKWRDYSMAEAASFVTKNGTIIVCAVSQPYLPFLNNWLISITRQKHQEKVLGFFNFTSRRPRHLLQILELGYSVMYNDVDMVWFGDPFCYLEGNHDVYFSDDMAATLGYCKMDILCCLAAFIIYFFHASSLWLISCVIFLRPTDGAKLVDLYLLPQTEFPTGGLYFKNQTWVQQRANQGKERYNS